MGKPAFVIELAEDAQLAKDLAAGGVFVPALGLNVFDELDLRVKGAAGEMMINARVVYIDPARGAGLELVGFGPEMKERLLALGASIDETPAVPVRVTPAAMPALTIDPDTTPDPDSQSDEEDEPDDPSDEGKERKRLALNAAERLRGISLAEQIKIARGPSASERMALERMYGKNVWEALLRNPGLTAPEVSRLARLGTLPRVLMELIVANNTWLQVPEIRRALLANPRLGADQIPRVLRFLPKHELKLAATIPAYPHAVRSVAKRMAAE